MRLIAIEPAHVLPRPVYEPPFLDIENSGLPAWFGGRERYRHADAGEQKLVSASRDHEAAGRPCQRRAGRRNLSVGQRRAEAALEAGGQDVAVQANLLRLPA